MQTQPGDTYAAVALLWSALYGAPPPADQDAGEILDALIGAMEPLAYDKFYDPYLRSGVGEGAAARVDAVEAPLPSPARVRALDVALRGMLQTCPVPDRLRSIVEQIDSHALTAPELHLDGVDS